VAAAAARPDDGPPAPEELLLIVLRSKRTTAKHAPALRARADRSAYEDDAPPATATLSFDRRSTL